MNLLSAFLELDKLYESTNWVDRETLIKDILASGKKYNFDKYSDAQLYRIWERIQNDEMVETPTVIEPPTTEETCETCGERLNPLGQCPICDLGEEDLAESVDALELGNHITDNYIFPSSSAKYDCIRELKSKYQAFDDIVSQHDIDNAVAKFGGKLTENKKALTEAIKADFLSIEGFDYYIEDTFEDEGYTGYEVIYSKDGHDIVKVELWEDGNYVAVIENLYAPNLMQRTYETFEQFAEDLEYKCTKYLHEAKSSNWNSLLTEAAELSNEHAVVSVVDQVKAVYEAGLFDKLPVGRKNAFTVDIAGPDKERLTAYFRKQPEFSYEMNDDANIISHEFISDKYDVEIFDSFISMYKIPQNESLLEEQEKVYTKKNGDYIIKNDNGGYTAFSSHNIYLGHIEEEDPREAQFKFEKNKFDEFFTESVFDTIPNKSSWVTVSGNSINNGNAQVTAVKSPVNSSSQTSNVVTIVYDNKAHKLRARANDGVHGEANVAFPNNLRTSEGLQYEVEELVWNGKNYRAVGDITPVNTITNVYNNINENKENYKMNFQTILEELDKLYEEEQLPVEKPEEEALIEDADEEVLTDDEPIVDDEAVEVPVDETEEAPKQLVLECSKCGALSLKNEEEVVVDEATDLANVEEKCQFCEEAEGYKILGAMVPYDGAVVSDDAEDVEDTDEATTESLTEGKLIDNVKKVATRVGADTATILRSFTELGEIIANVGNNDEYKTTKLNDFMQHVEDKAVFKALMNGNETVLNGTTKEDLEDLVADIEEYKKEKADKKVDKEDLEELLDVDLDVPVTIKADNNEVAVGGATI